MDSRLGLPGSYTATRDFLFMGAKMEKRKGGCAKYAIARRGLTMFFNKCRAANSVPSPKRVFFCLKVVSSFIA
ncbi:MAG: hypothetical protein CVV13_14080 [Gammaproteobacteria bacterium HGW-Gammaproteobacteria-3]|nr:MAG: hypothetical protein CVV13_14080 [Gammaproteobacteria bacterium HGW-Gammaproteobacteria-3]